MTVLEKVSRLREFEEFSRNESKTIKEKIRKFLTELQTERFVIFLIVRKIQ